MIKYNELLSKMKTHFPRWMAIRRKMESSTGGNMLSSIAENIVDINDAIDDYKKDFFITNYVERDDIVDFIYECEIGKTDVKNVVILYPDIKITELQSEFYGKDDLAYYESGKIFFRQDYKEVKIKIHDYTSSYELEKIHVWNIYDEFAIFLGLRRYENETNKELLNRIISYNEYKVNNSEEGLKRAIIANLSNKVSNLSLEDIKIEKTTPKNLMKYYDGFERIIDHLSSVNKDTFKEKRWDIDIWEFDRNSVDYIPHAWDVALKSYINGIGFEDDLEAVLIDDNNEADITMMFYKKKIEIINAYIQNTNMKETVTFNLKKYDDDIKSLRVAYRISASETEVITPSKIRIDTIESKADTFDVPIEDIVDDYKFGIKKEDARVLDPSYNYELSLTPINPLKELFIEELKVNDGESTNNLIEGFIPNYIQVNGGIKHKKTKAYIRDRYHFNKLNNIFKDIDGFMLEDSSIDGEAILSLSKYKNQKLYIDFDCRKSDVLPRDIKMTNCFMQGNAIIADTVSEEKTIKINIKACELSFYINGNVTIEYSINNGGIHVDSFNATNTLFEIPKSRIAADIDMRITFNESGAANNIKDIKYNSFDIRLEANKEELIENDDYFLIPNEENKELTISVKTYTAFSPVIKWIYIGDKLNDNDGISGIQVEGKSLCNLKVKADNCKFKLKKKDKVSGDTISIIEKYEPYAFYSSVDNSSRIELFLDEYNDIRSIEVDGGTVETIVLSPTAMQHVLKIDSSSKISHIKISAKKDGIISKIMLSDVLNRKGYLEDFYTFKCSKNNRDIIAISSDNKVKDVQISKADITPYKNSSFVKVNIYDNKLIIPAFISLTGKPDIDFESSGEFDLLSFSPIEAEEFFAINDKDIIFNLTSDIDIVDTFTDGYELCKKEMMYKVESLTNNFDIRFMGEGVFDTWTSKSVGINKVAIRRNSIDEGMLNCVTIQAKEILQLGSSIDIPQILYVNNEKIDVRRYMFENENIIYSDKNSDKNNSDLYIFSEKLYIDDMMYSKLKYSNVQTIDSIYHSDAETTPLIENTDYILMKDEGIIIWKNQDIVRKGHVILNYNIKIAKAIRMDIEKLYEKVSYNVLAYELMESLTIDKIDVNSTINLKEFSIYNDSDLVKYKCSNIAYDIVINNDILSLKRVANINSIAIKSGYYYMDGIEYYLFSDAKTDEVEKIDSLYFYNVEKKHKQFIFKQPTTNYVSNSKLIKNTSSYIHCLKCDDKNIENVSDVHLLTACDSFNHWVAPNSLLSICDAHNDVGMKVTPMYNGRTYCYVQIDTGLTEGKEYKASFYLQGEGKYKAYLGRERKIYTGDYFFNKEGNVEIVEEAVKSEIIKDIYTVSFKNNEDKYYLVIEGSAVIDDIIITESNKYNPNNHVKNVNVFNLNIEENIYSTYSTRFITTDDKGAIFNGTEDKDSIITNSSYIHWGFTNIKSYNTRDDFMNCYLENVDIVSKADKASALTYKKPGKIITKPIFLGNEKTINTLVIKINNVLFKEMKDFSIKVQTASSPDSTFKDIQTGKNNIISINGKKLKAYLKIIVEMESDKVINNIDMFAEYLSNDTSVTSDKTVISGSYISKIYDAQTSANFKVSHIKLSNMSKDISNYMFYVRASKENSDLAIWTPWKELLIKKSFEEYKNVEGLVSFEGYRYFQIKAVLKGADAAVKIEFLDLEVL